MADELRQSSGSTTTMNTSGIVGDITTENSTLACGCNQPGPETIQVEQVLGASMQQRVVESVMTVPDAKPSIEQILDVYVKDLQISSISVISGKVVVRGTLAVKIMYVAALPDQPVHAFEQDNVHWTRDIQIDGARPGMTATADVVVEYVNYDFRATDPRQVYITIILKVWTRVVTTTDVDVYALSPVSEVAQPEVTSANAAEQMSTSMGAPPEAEEQQGQPVESNVVVTGPGITSTAGMSASVTGTAIVNGNGVNVRSGPGTNFPVVSKLDKGEVVTLKDQAFGWNKVVLSDGNTTGWIAGWLLNIQI